MIMDLKEESLKLHKKLKGKLKICGKCAINDANDLSLLYTPGVAEACKEIERRPDSVYDLTIKNNTVGILCDGTRVLGLGNIGPEASLPVLEGKALIMKEFADIDAFPIALRCTELEEIVRTIRNISPVFGAINIEDIETPKVFALEKRLEEELDIPVFHDDQHGTAVVALAALYNALRIAKKDIKNAKIVVVGSGSAGYGITRLLCAAGAGDVICFDSAGAIGVHRSNLPKHKLELAESTNRMGYEGPLSLFKGADAIISAASPGALPHETVKNMAGPKIVFSLANPVPELSLKEAKALGVEIYGSGRSDCPNQINNSLCFPGFLRALLDLRVRRINDQMKIAAARAIADCVSENELAKGKIVPDIFDKRVVPRLKEYIKKSLE
jgi:malate dehydrogenase (oxaloacetate-decarboxylating)